MDDVFTTLAFQLGQSHAGLYVALKELEAAKPAVDRAHSFEGLKEPRLALREACLELASKALQLAQLCVARPD